MNEKIVSIENDGQTLAGTLTLPSNKPVKHCILMIGGSGALDRNQNSANLQLNLFNSIAEQLAQSGSASIRYDKRGCGLSTGNFDAAGHSDLVEDAACWLEYLRNHADFQKIPLHVLGHGEGALIGAQLAAANPIIAGQIMLAPSTENYADVIQRQAENALQEIVLLPGVKGRLFRFFLRLGGDQIAKQKKLINRISRSSRPTIKVRKQVINAKWIREMIQLDPLAIHAGTNIPTLAIAGSKDLQSQSSDIQQLKSVVRGTFESHIIPDLTHVLRTDPDEPSVRHFARLSKQEIDRRIISIIRRWLSHQARTAPST